jgi:hypothetical protein
MSGPERHTEPDRGFGRDGISGLVDANRALRARDVSRPGPEELEAAERVVAATLARLERPRH